jgi:hypothetical protein
MWPGVVITGVHGLLLSIFPESGKATVDFLFAGMTQNFKWFFLLFGIFFAIVLIRLASSRWGSIKLDEMEFSTYSWAAMIFYAPFSGDRDKLCCLHIFFPVNQGTGQRSGTAEMEHNPQWAAYGAACAGASINRRIESRCPCFTHRGTSIDPGFHSHDVLNDDVDQRG